MGLGVTEWPPAPPLAYESRMLGGGGCGGRGAADVGVIMGLDRTRRCNGDADPDLVGEVTETPTLTSFLLSSASSCSGACPP
jgi:hypothetical protein